MELKWLEDFVCVAEKGHFARAAEDRNITQSALSRRIKSLELWVGSELLDRTHHPIKLTATGEEFIQFARDIIHQSYKGRSEASEYARIADTGVTITSLHTLAMFFVPNLVGDLRKTAGAFEASVIADARTVEEFLEGLAIGSSDFFICYNLQLDRVLNIDPEAFPRLNIGTDRVLPYQLRGKEMIDFSDDARAPIPYLEYGSTALMSRVVEKVVAKAPFKSRLKTVYRATLAESLATAALRGLGVAWLPETIYQNLPDFDRLVCLDRKWSAKLYVSIYRAASNKRPVVDKIWNELQKISF